MNTTYLIVLALDQTNYYVYINPPLDGSAATPDVVYPHGVSYSSVTNVVFSQNNFGHYYIDGIRISSNFSDLTPNALAPEPQFPPVNLSFAGVTSGSLAATYSPGQDNPNSSLAVSNAGTAVSFIPSDGTGFTAGQNVGNGDVISLPGGCCTINETGLLPETNYFYRIFSANQTGSNATINYLTTSYLEGSQYTLSLEPAADPASFSVSTAGSSQVGLAFSDAGTIANADGYVLLRRQDGSDPATSGFVNGVSPGNFVLPGGTTNLGLVNAGATSYVDSGLSAATKYNYAIIAFNWDGTHAATFNYHTSGIKTVSSYTLTQAPNALPATNMSPSGFTASWDTVPGALQYGLDVSSDNFATFLPGYNNFTLTDTTTVVTGLAAGIAYQFQVRAENAAGSSANSNVISAITVPATPAAQAASSVSTSGFTATWNAVAGADNYNIELSVDGFTTHSDFNTSLQSIAINGLSPGTNYQYKVQSENSSGSSGFSSPISVVTFPPAPTALAASAITQAGFTAVWNTVAAVSQYGLDISSDNFVTFLPGYNNFMLVDSTSTLTGLSAGTSYQYRVRAVNAAGASANSNIISTMTVPAAPTAQQAASVSTAGFTGTWDLIPGAANYTVELSLDGFVTYSSYNTTFQSIAISGLNAGTDYQYRVQSKNSSGASGYSNLISLITLSAAPTALLPSAVSKSGFTSNWNSVRGAAHYLLDVSPDNFSTFLPGYNNLAVPDTSSIISGLISATDYQYRVKAVNASGASAVSNFIIIPTIPAGPTGLNVSQALSSSFVINWTSVTGVVDHYEVDVSTDNFKTFVPGYQSAIVASSAGYEGVSNLSPATLYQFRVRAVNSSGASENASSAVYTLAGSGDAFTLKLSDPSFNPVTSVSSSSGVVTTQVSNAGTATVTVLFYHKKIMDNDYTADLIALSSDKYQAGVSSMMFDELGMEFYFYASDNLGRKDSTARTKIYQTFDAGSSPAFIDGVFSGTFNDYQIVSIPYDLADNLIETIFGGKFGAYDVRKWRLGHYQDGQVQEFGNGINRIDRGRGYWFNARSQDSVAIRTGAGGAPKNDDNPYVMNLGKGWNQIGNPYPFNIRWSSVIAANPSVTGVGPLKVFTNGNFSDGDMMKPFTGGFVFCDKAVTLSVPVSVKTLAGGRVAGSTPSSDLDDPAWQVTLSLTQGERVNHLGGIGMNPLALDGKDEFDDLTLPRFEEYLEVVHSHAEYFYSSFSRDVIASAGTHTWKFTVESSSAEEATLHWDNNSLGTGEAMLFLLDVQNSRIINMKEQGDYSFAVQGKNEFQIFYSKTKADVLFDADLLGVAYPNPFVTSTSIPFVLAAGGSVELSVYDLTGRKSTTLIAGDLPPGYHVVSWDGTDEHGSVVSPGVYVYRLAVNNKALSKRMIMK